MDPTKPGGGGRTSITTRCPGLSMTSPGRIRRDDRDGGTVVVVDAMTVVRPEGTPSRSRGVAKHVSDFVSFWCLGRPTPVVDSDPNKETQTLPMLVLNAMLLLCINRYKQHRAARRCKRIASRRRACRSRKWGGCVCQTVERVARLCWSPCDPA